MPEPVTVPLPLDLAAVAFGAVQGAVYAADVARERGLDILGVVVVGIAVGLGGGILRDVFLDELPAALRNGAYLTTAVAAATAGMLFARVVNRLVPLMVAVDATALGFYLAVGAGKAAAAGLAPVAVVFVGLVASTGGSVLRDLLIRSPVALVQVGSLYAVAALAGAVAFAALYDVGGPAPAALVAIAITFAVRMLSLAFGWHSPHPLSIHDAWQRFRTRRADPPPR